MESGVRGASWKRRILSKEPTSLRPKREIRAATTLFDVARERYSHTLENSSLDEANRIERSELKHKVGFHLKEIATRVVDVELEREKCNYPADVHAHKAEFDVKMFDSWKID
jgi:hypothetical protein